MNYSKIYNDFKSLFLNHKNDEFIEFLIKLKDDNIKYDRRYQDEFIKRIKNSFRVELSNLNIEEQIFNRYRNLYFDGIRDYKNAPDVIELALNKKVIPTFNEDKPKLCIDDLIKLLAINDAVPYLDKIIQNKSKSIKHNFEKNQINKVSIITDKSRKRKTKTLPSNGDLWEIEQRLFLFFIDKTMLDESFKNKIPKDFCYSLDSSFIDYARFIANTLGVEDKNLYLKGKYIKSPIYLYVKGDKFKKHQNNIKFLTSLDLLELPKSIKARINIFISKARKNKK